MSSSPNHSSVDAPPSSAGAVAAAELQAAGGAEILDRRHLSQLQAMQVQGRGSLFLELVDIFRREAPCKLERLQSAIGARDLELIAKAAHAMVGSLSTLGARQMQHALRALEHAAAASDWNQIERSYKEVLSAWQRLQDALCEIGAKEVV